MNSTVNDVIYRFSSDESFRAVVQADPESALRAIPGLSAEEREILCEVFARKPEPTELPDFLANRVGDNIWLLPIIDSVLIEE